MKIFGRHSAREGAKKKKGVVSGFLKNASEKETKPAELAVSGLFKKCLGKGCNKSNA